MSFIKSPLELDHFLTDVLIVLAELDLVSLENASLVCRSWKALTESKAFWNQVVKRRWTTDVGHVVPGSAFDPSHPCPYCRNGRHPTYSSGCIYRKLLFRHAPPHTFSGGIFLLNGPPRSFPPSNPRSWIRALSRLKKSIHLFRTAKPRFHISGYNSEIVVSDVLPILVLADPNQNVQDNVESYLTFQKRKNADAEEEHARARMHTGDESWFRFWGKDTWVQWKDDQDWGMQKWFPNPVSFLCQPSHKNGNLQCCAFIDVSLEGYLYGFIQAIVLS